MKQHSLIVGGTRGVGRELVRLLAGQGHVVSVIGRRPPGAADQELKDVHHWTLDVTDQAAVQSAVAGSVQKNGPLHNLVFLQRFKGEGDKWAGELATTLTATQQMIEAVVPHFAATGDKSIVVVSSIADVFVADSQPAGYHVAKAGLHQLACYYAVVLGPKGIRVNCVSPCTVVKEENRDFYQKSEALQDLFRKTIPLGRMGTSADTANLIGFLCSPQASFITGQRIAVDGGVSLVSQEALARKVVGI